MFYLIFDEVLGISSISESTKILGFLAIIIVAGYLIGKLMELIKIPAITGYIIAGILIGPDLHIFPFVDESLISSLKIISQVALGFIAFSIGTELWIPKLKKSGKKIILITLFQALVTVVVTFLSLLVFQQPLWLCLILASIATATAPAPIMMIVKRYQAKGEVTDTLVPVVGIDDAVGIIVYGICSSIAISLLCAGTLNVQTILLEPLKEIGLSILLGSGLGLILGLIAKITFKHSKKDKQEMFLSMILALIFIAVAVADLLNLSAILTPMMVGLIFTNMIDKDTFRLETKTIDRFTPPLMIAFFTLAGADLKISVLPLAGLACLIYLIFRSAGKIGGAYLGAKISHTDDKTKKWLGLALLPQGGVEIGLVLAFVTAASRNGTPEVTAAANLVQTIVLGAILVYEIVGPFLTKFALVKAGEINPNVEIESELKENPPLELTNSGENVVKEEVEK